MHLAHLLIHPVHGLVPAWKRLIASNHLLDVRCAGYPISSERRRNLPQPGIALAVHVVHDSVDRTFRQQKRLPGNQGRNDSRAIHAKFVFDGLLLCRVQVGPWPWVESVFERPLARVRRRDGIDAPRGVSDQWKPCFLARIHQCEIALRRLVRAHLDAIDARRGESGNGVPRSLWGCDGPVIRSFAFFLFPGPFEHGPAKLDARAKYSLVANLLAPFLDPIYVPAHVAHRRDAVSHEDRNSGFVDIRQVYMHVPQPRNQELASPVNDGYATRRRLGRLNRYDSFVIDVDRHVLLGRLSRAVDHGHVSDLVFARKGRAQHEGKTGCQ